MKQKFCLIFLISLGYSLNMLGQSILAGIHGASEYFYDFNPDKVLFAPIISFPSYNADTFLIDMNNDNINDFRISTISDDGGNWYDYVRCLIEPLNNNQVSIGSFDSCFANCPPDSFIYKVPMVQPYSFGDSINNNALWIDSMAFLSYTRHIANVPNGCGYTCGGAVILPNSSFLGVKVITLSDTLFGWIKVKDVQVNSVTLEEFACNLYSTSIDEFHSTSTSLIYPNPNSGIFTIRNSFPNTSNCNLKIYDLLGNLFYDKSLDFINSEIDLGSIPKGIYFLNLTSESESLSSRIIIQ